MRRTTSAETPSLSTATGTDPDGIEMPASGRVGAGWVNVPYTVSPLARPSAAVGRTVVPCQTIDEPASRAAATWVGFGDQVVPE